MYHVVLILLVVVFLALMWQLVHCSPRFLSLVLPPRLALALGLTWLIMGVFAAFAAAYVLQSPELMLRSLVHGFVGLWFLLAMSAGMRGSESDEQMLRRLFLMMSLLTATLVGILYVGEPRGVAILNLLLVTFGFWVTTNYLRFLDRGR